jgi:hypothetical protein
MTNYIPQALVKRSPKVSLELWKKPRPMEAVEKAEHTIPLGIDDPAMKSRMSEIRARNEKHETPAPRARARPLTAAQLEQAEHNRKFQLILEKYGKKE